MADTRQPGFLRLPYEMREIIYKLLLISDQWIVAETKSTKGTKPDKLHCYKLPFPGVANRSSNFGGWSAQLLRVCKLFDEEASQFLYGHNKFKLSLKTLQDTFLPTVGTGNASYVRYIDLSRIELSRFKATYTIPTVLQAFPNLRCLYFTAVSQGPCTNECQSFCKHTPSQLKILVLRMAYLITTTHAHLKWFLEFKCSAHQSPAQMWHKLSDDESNRHPQRSHQHTSPQYWLSDPPPMSSCEASGEVLDIEKELTRVKVVRVKVFRSVQRAPLPIAERPAWRM
jgi:hypothetical protein